MPCTSLMSRAPYAVWCILHHSKVYGTIMLPISFWFPRPNQWCLSSELAVFLTCFETSRFCIQDWDVPLKTKQLQDIDTDQNNPKSKVHVQSLQKSCKNHNWLQGLVIFNKYWPKFQFNSLLSIHWTMTCFLLTMRASILLFFPGPNAVLLVLSKDWWTATVSYIELYLSYIDFIHVYMYAHKK